MHKKLYVLTGLLLLLAVIPVDAAINKITRGPYLQNPSETNITIRYRSKEYSPSLIRYWTIDKPEEVFSFKSSLLTKKHSAELINLSPGKEYAYEIDAQEKSKIENISDNKCKYQFITQNNKNKASMVLILGDPGVSGHKNFRKKYKNNQEKVLANFYSYQSARELRDPDIVLSLGDNTYFYGSDEEYQKGFFEPYKGLLSKIPLYTVFGNHDAGIDKEFLTYNARSYPQPRGVYYDIFTLPDKQAYYSFNLGDAHFIVLDSFDSLWEELKPNHSNFERIWTNTSKGKNIMLDWLKNDLEINNAQWTIVAFHHPPYGSDEEGSSKKDLWRAWMNAYVVPLIEKHRVDLVLCGHIHNYQRSFPVKSILEKTESTDMSAEAYDTDPNDSHKKKIKEHKIHYREKLKKILGSLNLPHYQTVVQSTHPNKYTQKSGIIYTILGSSGAAFNTIDDNPNKMFAIQAQIEGSMVLAITPKTLSARFITIQGDIIDEFQIEDNK